MKVSREHAAANRERILDEAARLFRERGFSGVGIGDLMKSVGLTHGGFYGHFSSKQELVAEACQRAIGIMLDEWNRLDAANENPLPAITARYLSTRHRDGPGGGCLMAALGPEISRQASPVRRAVTECLGSVIDTLARMTPGRSAAARRKKAVTMFASMVGALVVARAVNDPKLSRDILQAVSASILSAQRA